EAPRLILTDLNPPYVHAMTEPGTQVAPLYDDHLYRNNPKVFEFGEASRRRLVTQALEQGRPVWALTQEHEIRGVHEAFSAPEGFDWEIVASAGGPGLARLVPR
ncbi:MAG: hypothetical protein AAF725_27055, partial [Acidobacteriota bacterium]